jgi:hypothetical protein
MPMTEPKKKRVGVGEKISEKEFISYFDYVAPTY